MWLYIYYCIASLLLTNAVTQKNYNLKKYQPTEESETLFADVIKNISRVNNVLQELINNYEQIQKIYKSQENEEKDYSSDTEVDELFKNINIGKDKQRSRDREKPTKKPSNKIYPATQMIWSDNEGNEDTTDNKSQEIVENKPTKDKPPSVDNLKPDVQISTVKQPTVQSNVETSSESLEEMGGDKLTNGSKGPEIIFIDTHQKGTPVQEVINDEKKMQLAAVSKAPKTRYSKISHTNKNKNNKKKSKKRLNVAQRSKITRSSENAKNKGTNIRNIKKIVYTETFSPKNIWNEIINNKPIKLETHKEITYNRKPSLRSGTGKTALIIVTKNNNKKHSQPTTSTESVNEEEDITKDIFKTNVLRQAYGEACLKVVIRKCYKACKQAGKMACNRYKCKSNFKDKYKELSKTGCLNEFNGESNNTRSAHSLHGRQEEKTNGFIDATRSGYLEAVCLTYVQPKKKLTATRNNTQPLPTNPIDKHVRNVNILRDKYERACRKTSIKKCNAACFFAYKNACLAYPCEKPKLRVFKKDCKVQCKAVYRVASSSKRDSDSDSGDTESSDSDARSSDTDSSSSL